MTTLLLPPDEVARVRTLKGQVAYILAIMIILDRHHPGCAFKPSDVALIAGLDERTVAKQLKDLSALGRMILSASGYVLTEGGRAMFLPAGNPHGGNNEALALSPVSTPEQVLSPEPDNGQALQAQALQIIDAQAADIAAITEPTRQKDSTHIACALEEEVNNLTLITKDTSSLTYLDTQVAQNLNLKLLFGKSYLLFGESVTKREAPLDQVLAIFAHVYETSSRDKSGIRYPARVAYAMLRDNKEPREEIAVEPWKFLPAKYLEALNVLRYECLMCDCELFSTSKDLEEHLQAAHPQKFVCEECGMEFSFEETCARHYLDEHTVKISPLTAIKLPNPNANDEAAVSVDEKAVRIWNAVLDQLKTDMHISVFNTWLRDTNAIRFDGNNLVVGARNAATREWLENRIKNTVQRLLVGVLCHDVNVVFVVAQSSDVEE